MDFIEVYDDALPADACAEIVRAFEASGAAVPGRVGGGVMPDLKDSGDIHITGRPEWREADEESFDLALEILEQAAAAWRTERVPFWALMPVADPFSE